MQTAVEPTDIDDAGCLYGQNVDIGSGGAFGPRLGCSLHGDRSTANGRILSTFTAKLRNGTEIAMRVRSVPDSTKAVIEWYNSTANAWELLFDPGTALDQTARMGFVQWNTTATDRTYMCNGIQAWIKWTNITSVVVSNDAVSVTLASGTNFAASGSVIINSTVYSYSGKSSNTLTGMTIVGTFAVNEGVAVVPTNPSMAVNSGSVVLTNVFIAHLSRLWLGKNSVMTYSKTGNPESFQFNTPRIPGDGGTEDFPEGGGDITGFARRDDVLIVMKKDVLRTFKFDQTDVSTNEIPVSQPLGFASNIGPENFASLTSQLKEVFYTSQRYGLRQLTQILNATGSVNPALDILPLNDDIAPTVKNFDFGDSVAAAFDQKILSACKSDADATANDLIVVYDFRSKGNLIYKGWDVNDFYELDGELYFGSSTEPNCFKCFDGYTDDGGPIESIYNTKRWDFGEPALRKYIPLFYIEGRIGDGTEIEATINLDDEGSTQQIVKTISWDGDYVTANVVGSLGAEELGIEALGGTIEAGEDLNKFRVYLTLPVTAHYNVEVIIRCDSLGGRYKVSALAPNPSALREPSSAKKL